MSDWDMVLAQAIHHGWRKQLEDMKEIGGWENVVDKPGKRVPCPCLRDASCVRVTRRS